MDTVSLPNGPDESLQQAVRFLSSWIAPPDYRLGGGTALAALWGHRHSTDIDLAATHGSMTRRCTGGATRSRGCSAD